MPNSPSQQAEIATRLGRISGLSGGQITTLSQSLDYASVEQWSDTVLAAAATGSLPTAPLNPQGGLPLGLPGAVAATRYVGATAAGAPTTGSFLVGDFVVTQIGGVLVCITAGSPGTWVRAGESVSNLAAQSGSITLDLSTASTFIVNLTGNVTGWTFSNGVAGQAAEVHFVQDATGSRTLAGTNASIKLAGGSLTLTTTASKRDVLRFRNVAGTFYETSRSLNI